MGRGGAGEARRAAPQVGGGDGGDGALPKGAGAVSMTTALPLGGGRGEPPEDQGQTPSAGEVLREKGTRVAEQDERESPRGRLAGEGQGPSAAKVVTDAGGRFVGIWRTKRKRIGL